MTLIKKGYPVRLPNLFNLTIVLSNLSIANFRNNGSTLITALKSKSSYTIDP